jgi:cytochrome c peroxidase
VELTIRNIQHGVGFLSGEVIAGETAGRSKELDALAAYMASLAPPPSPFSVEAETLQRGEYAFARWGCAGCHIGHALTDQQLHDLKQDRIGDATLQHNPRGLAFDTPALIGVWASAPYFHDGSSVLLRETLYRAGFHGMGWAMDKQEAEDLVAYVLSR